MPLILNVPFEEKDQAKALGARWCPEIKKWYAPDRVNYSQFAKWLDGSIAVYDQIYIVEGIRTCYSCKKQTKVIGFGIDKFFDVFSNCLDFSKGVICISNIESRLPTILERELEKRYGYKWSYSKTTRGYCNANHCCHCGAMQGNYFLFEEVDSPFFIDGEETAEKLILHRIDLPCDIAVSATIGFGSEDYLIKECAQIVESDMRWITEALPDRLLSESVNRPQIEERLQAGATQETRVCNADQPTNPKVGITNSMPWAPWSTKTQGSSSQNWTEILLLAIFLGWLGVHRFCTGKIATGMLYALTFGLLGIGWLIDVIRILAGSFTDESGCKIRKRQ